MKNKADYNMIARTFDRSRSISESNLRMWLDPIAENNPGLFDLKVVDLGCGTGRFTLPLAYLYGYNVVGVDFSEEMLSIARSKDLENKVHWKCQDVERLSFKEESFDIAFMSHLIHHLESPGQFLANCLRLLRKAGAIYIRYGAIEQISNDVVHTFFPSATDIDAERTPGIQRIETWLREAGFSAVQTLIRRQRTYEDAAERLKTIKLKSTSVLTLISESEFAQGIRKLEKYVENHKADTWLQYDIMSLTIGNKNN